MYDQYLNFISLEPRLFSLRLPEAFLTLNSPSSHEADVAQMTDAIATGLLSVLATLGAHYCRRPTARPPGGGGRPR